MLERRTPMTAAKAEALAKRDLSADLLSNSVLPWGSVNFSTNGPCLGGGSIFTYEPPTGRGDPKVCTSGMLRAICTRSKPHQKTTSRQDWEDSRERVRANRLSVFGKDVYPCRKETIERSFADAMG